MLYNVYHVSVTCDKPVYEGMTLSQRLAQDRSDICFNKVNALDTFVKYMHHVKEQENTALVNVHETYQPNDIIRIEYQYEDCRWWVTMTTNVSDGR